MEIPWHLDSLPHPLGLCRFTGRVGCMAYNRLVKVYGSMVRGSKRCRPKEMDRYSDI